jgi:hypothetical protein
LTPTTGDQLVDALRVIEVFGDNAAAPSEYIGGLASLAFEPDADSPLRGAALAQWCPPLDQFGMLRPDMLASTPPDSCDSGSIQRRPMRIFMHGFEPGSSPVR